MRTKTIVAIVLVIAILLGGVVAGIIFLNRSNKLPEETSSDNETVAPSTETEPIGETTGIESIQIPALDGNPTLTEERNNLVDRNLLSQIIRLRQGVPVCDENGYYSLDADGNLIHATDTLYDYSNVADNILVLVNACADNGYTEEANKQVQRFYFEFCADFRDMAVDELLAKLFTVIPSEGTTPEAIAVKADEVFGMNRENGFDFVFESLPTTDVIVCFCDVKPNNVPILSEAEQTLCIYRQISNGDETEVEQNLMGWLSEIVHALSEDGCSEKSIISAQLLYIGSLADREYRSDILPVLSQLFSAETEYTQEDFAIVATAVFGVDIADNLLLSEYLNGTTAY